MMLLIRPGLLTDRFAIHAIRDSALDMFGAHSTLAEIPEINFDEQSGFRIRVACEDNKPLGYAMVQSCGDDLYLRQMFVDQRANHHGVGSHLLKELLAHAAKHNFKSVSLITSQNAPWTVPFYSKFGFSVQDSARLPDHINQNIADAKTSKEIQNIPHYLPIIGMTRTVKPDDISLNL